MSNRGDGLVQRRAAAQRAVENGLVSGDGTNGTGNPNGTGGHCRSESDGGGSSHLGGDDFGNEYDDADSKDTRLTLMEEVLLLGLKDKEVSHPLQLVKFNTSLRKHDDDDEEITLLAWQSNKSLTFRLIDN